MTDELLQPEVTSEEVKRHCVFCQKNIKKGFVCNACKNKNKIEYNREYQKTYYQKRREDYKKMRDDLAKYKQLMEKINENKESK